MADSLSQNPTISGILAVEDTNSSGDKGSTEFFPSSDVGRNGEAGNIGI